MVINATNDSTHFSSRSRARQVSSRTDCASLNLTCKLLALNIQKDKFQGPGVRLA
jgi:hypothetical protein